MANSFLDYKDKYLRLGDLELALVFSLLIRLGRERGTDQEALDGWENVLRSRGPGLYNFDLSGRWESEEGRKELVDLLNRARAALVAEGERISSARANWILLTDRFSCVDLDKGIFHAAINKIQSLISK